MEAGWYIVRFYENGMREIIKGPYSKSIDAQIELDKLPSMSNWYYDLVWCEMWRNPYAVELQSKLYKILLAMVDDIDDDAEVSAALEILRCAAQKNTL